MKKTLKFCLATGALAIFSLPVLAQEAANPLSGGQKYLYGMISGALVGAAEKMPDAEYSFRPTPEVRTFGELVGHAADAQYMFCSIAAGEQNPMKSSIAKTKTTKADLVQGLKDAVGYCEKVYSGMTDAQSSQIVKFFGHDAAKGTVLTLNLAHDDEHYGNMVTYLRIKGIVPPTSEKKM